MSVPACAAAWASSVAPHSRTMNTAVEKRYVVERIEIIERLCSAMMHGQSSGVASGGGPTASFNF